MASAGIRELKDNLSQFIRRTEAGETVVITAHGRVVAKLVPPAPPRSSTSRLDELIAAGVIQPPIEEDGAVLEWPAIELPSGTASALIDADRGEE